MLILRDHPDIENALRTGYPRGGEPKPYYCEICEDIIEDEDDVYEDEFHDFLCKHCLMERHKKRW